MSNKRKPAEVVLRFRTKDERDYFVGQLLDGFGEGQAHYEWDGKKDGARGRDAPAFDVEPCGEYWDHYKRMKKWRP